MRNITFEEVPGYNIVTGIYGNPIDACYEMIIKLNKLNLL